MDSYVDAFMAAGGSMVTLAKGNRSKAVTNACKKHKGFYLGSIGEGLRGRALRGIQQTGGNKCGLVTWLQRNIRNIRGGQRLGVRVQ